MLPWERWPTSSVACPPGPDGGPPPGPTASWPLGDPRLAVGRLPSPRETRVLNCDASLGARWPDPGYALRMAHATGPASPLPSTVAIDLQRLVEQAPRIAGARFVGERAEVTMRDPDGYWSVELPAMIRGRLVTNLNQLVEIEVEAPIDLDEVSGLRDR